jgi:aspartyl-tRNA(Asn)/glutamyl-tRNA(Gln) amidotransferase subunit A
VTGADEHRVVPAGRGPARSLADAVRRGERRAIDVVEEHLAAIEALDDQLHCFLTVTDDLARRQAEAVDAAVARGEDPGPLAGVPVAVKDNLCLAGVETTCASRILAGWRPPYDATVVARLGQAGAVVLGKTNLDEFAMGSSTEASAFGPTRNPHAPDRVPGGSSGGSAAAVAAGLAPLALGSDTGGSIRQPAAFCGVVGLKPTYGTVSRYGLVAFASSLDQVGPFAPTVGDAAVLFEAIAGHDPADSTSWPEPLPSCLAALGSGAEGLRVGVVDELTQADGIDADVRRRVTEAAEVLEAAGATVEPVSVPELRYALPAYYLLAPAEASSNLARYDGVRYGLRVEGDDVATMNARTRAQGFGAEVKRRILLGTYALSAGYYDAYYAQAQRVRTVIAASFAAAYGRFDVLVGATTPTTAFLVGEKADDPLAMYLSDICTIPSNLAGHPAISVPFGTDRSGLPVGVQVLAPAFGEPKLCAVAAVLEDAAPPLRPPVVAASVAGAGR